MKNLEDLEKKINSELTTKIKETFIKHDQLYIKINAEDLQDVVLLLKSNNQFIFFSFSWGLVYSPFTAYLG